MHNFLFDILLKLGGKDIDFVVCGGLALVLQGGERSTFDLDLYLALTEENLSRSIEIFKNNDYIPRIPEPIEYLLDEKKRTQWINEKQALVYTLVSANGQVQVDVFLAYPIEYGELKDNADIIQIDGVEIRISSKRDLIRAKQAVRPAREKDLFDIKVLEQLIRDEENGSTEERRF